jgi:predicted signal transduction protein with EAL and GGDEF domain
MGLVVGLMGLIGLVLAITSGEIHSHLAFNNQRDALIELVRLKSDTVLDTLKSTSLDLGLRLQRSQEFRDALNNEDHLSLTQQLNNQFHQHPGTAEVISLEKIILFDPQFRPVAESTEGKNLTQNSVACPSLLKRAQKRQGPQRLRVLSDLCLIGRHSYHSVIVPVGERRLRGYLEIITEPVVNLRTIEDSLGMPIKIYSADGSKLFVSDKWQEPEANKNDLIGMYKLKTTDGKTAVYISVKHNIEPLNVSIQQTRLFVILVAGIVTVVATLISFWVLRKTSLNPLNELTRQVRKLHSDRKQLGKKVMVGGTSEISELATSFNTMTGELNNLYQALENMAFTDQLTQLPNRNLFHERLKSDVNHGSPGAPHFALLLMDLNRFKVVNDTLGHQVGDQLLQQVGIRLQHALRDTDLLSRIEPASIDEYERDHMVARLGGDEFSAILPKTDSKEAAAVVARKLIESMQPAFTLDGHKFVIGISIGIALYPEHGTDMHTLIRRADVAMYHAKKLHQGYAFYESRQRDYNPQHLNLEQDLRKAIAEDQFVLHYQPMVNMQNRTLDSAEALLYWQHPERGLMAPDEFIPLAEQTGHITELTAIVVNQAMADCAEWQRDGVSCAVSINLSALNMHDKQIVNLISLALKEWQLPVDKLILELTESAVMWDPQAALESLNKLDAMGVRLSIDDFGTGYSSLSLLKKLPVDHIKIDKSFVKDFITNPNDEAIIVSTIVLAQHMGLTVIAEGVEELAVWNHLKTSGCDIAQGYMISKPLDIKSFRQWLEKTEWQLQDNGSFKRPRSG